MKDDSCEDPRSSTVRQGQADNGNAIPLAAEWLEADGLGGFASGTADGIRTRRYHALLLSAATPPTGRVVLVNGIEARVETDSGATALSAQRYDLDTVNPGDAIPITSFTATPWPHWQFTVADGAVIGQEVFVVRDSGDTVLRWRRLAGSGGCRLVVRPLMSGRDYHALHRANPSFNFTPMISGGNVAWRPYPDLPATAALTNGDYTHQPVWYYNFLYSVERDRGLDHIEDLASPGAFTWDLSVGDAVLILRSGDGLVARAAPYAMQLAQAELLRRDRHSGALSLPAESYLVDRGHGRTLLAGFPWFTDWGRDTFIAMRGLVITTSKLADAEAILVEWAHTVSEGMLPNRFPDGGAAEYNSVDASLWFIIAVHDFLAAAEANSYRRRRPDTDAVLRGAVLAILKGYARGTRYGIHLTGDGLLAAGVPGVQLTWMDAKLGDWVVTPRIGKPVEVQALWINALRIGGAWSEQWLDIERRALVSFARYHDPATGGLYDVLDADGVAGAVDRRIRPNQILAVGGLPFQVLKGAAARAVVDLAERELLTPLGLRSLARSDPDYQPFYRGGPAQRDGAYHQGTVWPWLIGPFTEAWLRTRADTEAHKAEGKRRFLAPLLTHLGTAGLGHVSEVADAEPPHQPGGCPFQAWSLGELIRALDMVEPARRVN
jgi:predicted glycogen debranching enzyme